MAALLQVGETGLHEHHGSERAALEGLERIGLVNIVDLAVLHGALGAVDEDVDAAEALDALGHHVVDLVDVGHVAGHGQHLPAEGLHFRLQLLELLHTAGTGADLRAVLGEHLGQAPAHPRAGPGHNGHAPLKFLHYGTPI